MTQAKRREDPSTAPRRVIINADDLGRSSGINDGIFEAHERGVVSSTTLMAGESAAGDAAARLADYPRLGVGLHLTLTGSRPTLPAGLVPSLVDSNGCFPRKPEQIRDFAPRDLLAEMRNQLRIFRELTGRLPTHLDSHHHSHTHPRVLEAVIELAGEHHFPVRRSSPTIGERLDAAGVATTLRFTGRFFGPDATLEVLLELLRDTPPGTTEIMCHPGYADDELRRQSGYADEREREIRILCDPAASAALRTGGLQLVHFGER